MTRRGVGVAIVAAVALVAVLALAIRSGGPEGSAPGVPSSGSGGLALLVVKGDREPLVAVIGSAGPRVGALAIPASLPLTIPGQGEGTVADAVAQPGAVGAVSISNLLGVWIDVHASTHLDRLIGLVERAGGIELAGRTQDAAEVRTALEVRGAEARELAWRTILPALLEARLPWRARDLGQVDDAIGVIAALRAAAGVPVEELPTKVSAGGLVEPDLEAIGGIVQRIFGSPNHDVVPVIVLNGSGAPGVGQRVASRIVPGGFRVVVSGNASSFDHDTTVVVASSASDRALAERVRDLLGVGQVAVSGPPSGLADLTILIGKDFEAG